MSSDKSPASLSNENYTCQFFCTLDRTANYTYDVPQYVIDSGNGTSYVTAVRNPFTIDMTVFESSLPVTWNSLLTDSEAKGNRVHDVKEMLLNMYLSDELFTLTTPNNVYENMVITALTFPEGDYKNAMEISISLKQVITTNTKTREVESYEYSGESEEETGTVETEEASASSSSTSSSSSSSSESSSNWWSDFCNWWKHLFSGNDFNISIGGFGF